MGRPVTRAMRRREEDRAIRMREEEEKKKWIASEEGRAIRMREVEEEDDDKRMFRSVTRARRSREEEDNEQVVLEKRWSTSGGNVEKQQRQADDRQREEADYLLAGEKQQGEESETDGMQQQEEDGIRRQQEEAEAEAEANEIRRQEEEEDVRQRQEEAEEELQFKLLKRKIELKLKVKVAPYLGKQKVILKPGKRSAKEKDFEKLTWECPECKEINYPQRRLFAMLPTLECKCGEKSTVQFDFSLHKIEMNNNYLVPTIREQLPKQCCPNSLLSTAEICWRIKSTLEDVEINEIQPNLSLDLLDKYYYCCRAVGIKQDRASRMNEGAIDVMCKVMATMGVESKGRNPMRYKFPYYTAVKKNFSSICKLLADGYVMTTTMYAGKTLEKLKPGKIYKSPRRGKTRHAITLVGAGRRRNINYYHFLNSWGRYFCLRKRLADPNEGIKVGMPRVSWRKLHRRNKARGGFAMLRVKDIASWPVTFLRHYEDFKFHSKLEIKVRSAKGKKKLEPVESAILLGQDKSGIMSSGTPVGH